MGGLSAEARRVAGTVLELVVAADRDLGIGQRGALPWRLKGDMAFFRELTQDAATPVVIMGRKTWESIPERFRPLRNRFNIVVTSQDEYALPDGVARAESFESAVTRAEQAGDRYFVIGGGQIYRMALSHSATQVVHLTEIDANFDCDTRLPALDGFERVWTDEWQDDGPHRYRFTRWVRS